MKITKWNKYKLLRDSDQLRSHMPKTKRLTVDHFQSMLNRYGTVVVKPLDGSGGKGVIRVRKTGSDEYEIHRYSRKWKVSGLREAYRAVKRKQEKRVLIVQRYIRLASVRGRPFDLRIMVQRRSKKTQDWTVTGRLAKIAGKGYMITNVRRSGGRVTSAEKAIRMSDIKGKDEAKQLLKQAEQISVASAKKLARTFTFIRRVGMDVGIDKNGKVWLIEANFRPSLSLFLKLSREAYNKIKRFG